MNKYNPKYFGFASGVLSAILFLVVLVNVLLSNNSAIESTLIPFIPFMTTINFFTVIGGIIVSFLWGVFLGYLFIIIYNFYDSLFKDRYADE